MHDFVIVAMIEPFGTVPFTHWPLHMTLLPWFAAPGLDEALAVLRPVALAHAPFTAPVRGREHFGPRRLPVRLVEITAPLRHLHEDLVAAITGQGWTIRGRYTGPHFRPHVTRQAGRDASGLLHVSALHVVESLPHQYRKPVGKLELGHG